MAVLIILLLAAAAVLFAVHYRTGKIFCEIAGVIAALAAMIAFVIALGQSGASSGGYTQYVNGVRVSSGFVAGSQNFVLILLFGAFANFATRGLGYLMGGRRGVKSTDPGGEKKASMPVLVISIIGAGLGVGILGGAVGGIAHGMPVASFVPPLCIGTAMIGLCIWGITTFIKRKKKT